MTIETWAEIWKFVLISCVGLFALMWIIVTVGAIRDAVSLHRGFEPNDPNFRPSDATNSDSES